MEVKKMQVLWGGGALNGMRESSTQRVRSFDKIYVEFYTVLREKQTFKFVKIYLSGIPTYAV